MNSTGILTILALAVTAVVALPQPKNALMQGPMHLLSMKQFELLQQNKNKINQITKNANPLELNMRELNFVMEFTLINSLKAVAKGSSKALSLLADHEETSNLVQESFSAAFGNMQAAHLRYVLLAGGLVEDEDIPELVVETTRYFQSFAETIALESEQIVKRDAGELLKQMQEINAILKDQVEVAIQPVLEMIKDTE